ncbi:hypothetical protein [Virgibacillus ndiopensis]|uniref:hypothetical protein n=1 Tax=Virgibacillus ndiopensis TaxID=2004408 RepID=UPI00159BADA6|nr:hypothetical protein [Virgibacillus ndiopensis]
MKVKSSILALIAAGILPLSAVSGRLLTGPGILELRKSVVEIACRMSRKRTGFYRRI